MRRTDAFRGQRSSRFAPLYPALAAAFLAAACGEAEVPDGALRGEVLRYIATFDDGHSQQSYALRPLGSADELPLRFASSEPDLPEGALIDVWGEQRAGALQVSRFEMAADSRAVEPVSRAILDAPSYPPRSFAFVLVDTSNGAVPMALSEEEATRRLFASEAGSTPSVRQYYVEASYGRQDVTGQVFGPLSFSMTGCNTSALTQALGPMIPGAFDHYLWFIHPRNTSCDWTGLAQGGRPDRPSRNTWYNASASCVVLVQEPGHNLGMNHSSAMKCPNVPFLDDPSASCSHQEYGDRYDPMGSGCGHMNVFQKAYQGWFERCNLVEATASGTFTLLPLEVACDGVQALQVPMPKTRAFSFPGGLTELTHYYVELRTPLGMDQRLAQRAVVQVRVSNDTRSRAQRGVHTWFLDMNPGTAALDGLNAGDSFADPTGSPRIIVEDIGVNSATVRVEFDGGGQGAPTCGDGTVLEGPGPGPDSCAAGPSTPEGTPPPIPGGPQPPVSGELPGCTCGVGGAPAPANAWPLLALAGALIAYRGRTRALRPRRSAS
jgi:hypothetical protein